MSLPTSPRHDEIVTVYSAASQLRQPLQLVRTMMQDAFAARWLAWRLLVRNLSARYRQALLGHAWGLLPPLLTTLVFVFLQDAGYFSVEKTPVPYGIFVLTGMTFWQVFADALQAPMRQVSQCQTMLTKVQFPREALIIAGAGEVLYSFAIRLLLLFVVVLWFDVPLASSLVYVPLGVCALLALGLALGLWLTPISILYQDVNHGLPFLVSLWMFATPVLYPAQASRGGSFFVRINPVTALLDTTRSWMLGGASPWSPNFFWIFGLVILALLCGWLLYRLALPVLIERMSG
ncbi:MAG: ABC transporter permease [Deltaproteobacteria bacterium]|nr:ABC transporter permease [Deltaproteobacteria bacterium]